ncbi:hypothetical protein RhiirA4_424484 [Rhizophagus irregularis]|uniref:Uncharacterized protein n=1 Tax=Rhizophagus irregularis TaxID=588596 RepID=A0A2I1GXN2_9GLOM|nr:hypothetical protein RhiirA4_424484 [Rhizophagus irregularis]
MINIESIDVVPQVDDVPQFLMNKNKVFRTINKFNLLLQFESKTIPSRGNCHAGKMHFSEMKLDNFHIGKMEVSKMMSVNFMSFTHLRILWYQTLGMVYMEFILLKFGGYHYNGVNSRKIQPKTISYLYTGCSKRGFPKKK